MHIWRSGEHVFCIFSPVSSSAGVLPTEEPASDEGD